MAIVTEKIPIHKHFLLIDSPVPFDLVLNNGTDECHRPAGAWRIDLYHLLPEKFFKQYPGFTLDIVYDDTNLGGQNVIIRQSDIDLGNGIAGVNGQEVYVTNFPVQKETKLYFGSINDVIKYIIENNENSQMYTFFNNMYILANGVSFTKNNNQIYLFDINQSQHYNSDDYFFTDIKLETDSIDIYFSIVLVKKSDNSLKYFTNKKVSDIHINY